MKTIAVDTGNKVIKTPLLYFPAGLVRHGTAAPPESEDAKQTEVIQYKGEYFSLSSMRTPYRYKEREGK